jgi:hypothetical protein
MRKALCSWSLLLLLAPSPFAGAFNDHLVDRICIADLAASAALEKRKSIPVGCELVDCCPGCPGPGPIEWRVAIDAKVLAGAELRFEGLSPARLKQLKIEGNAKRQGNRIVLGPGSSRIRGLPFSADAPVPVGLLRPLTRKKPAARTMPASGTVTEHVSVRQFRGQFLLNEFDWIFLIRRCGPIIDPPFFDKLRIKGIAAGDDVVVMLDGRTLGQCSDGAPPGPEWIFRSTGETSLPNLLAPISGCNSEIAIFSKKHAMKWETGVAWTNSPGDVHTVTLDPLIEVPVHIWVVDDATKATAQQHIDRAEFLYRENMVGLQLVPTIRKLSDVSSESDAFQTVRDGINNAGNTCLDGIDVIKTKPFYTAKTLNVYYVDKQFTGKNCAIKESPFPCPTNPSSFDAGDANITFVGIQANPTTVAHEIGHAFGLRPAACDGHTEGVTTIAKDNLMCTGTTCNPDRTTFTPGQVFRMNTHTDFWGGTMLIPNNIPGRTPRACAPNTADKLCPALELQWP